MDQQTTERKIPAIDLAMAEALYVYDVAARNGAPLLQARMLRLIALLRAVKVANV